MGNKYKRTSSDQWFTPRTIGYRAACCDCGLVHEMDFRLHDGRIQMRLRRNNRATAAIRRYSKVVLTITGAQGHE